MSVLFDNSGTKYVKWTAPSGVVGLTSKTITLDFYPTAIPAIGVETIFTITDGTGTDSDEFVQIRHYYTSIHTLIFRAHFSTNDGIWIVTSGTCLTLNAWNKIAISFNGSSASNDPSIYVNGTVKSITETVSPAGTPSGTYRTGTSTDLYVGNPASGLNPPGKVRDLRVYSSIKTAAEVSLIAAEDITSSPTIDESSLVFHAPLQCSKGFNYANFAGQTLAAGNTFFDRIGGYLGVPSGSPAGA